MSSKSHKAAGNILPSVVYPSRLLLYLLASPHLHIQRPPHQPTLFSTSLPLVTTYLPTYLPTHLSPPSPPSYPFLFVLGIYLFASVSALLHIRRSPPRSLLPAFHIPLSLSRSFLILFSSRLRYFLRNHSPLQSSPRRGPSSHNAYPFSQFHPIPSLHRRTILFECILLHRFLPISFEVTSLPPSFSFTYPPSFHLFGSRPSNARN